MLQEDGGRIDGGLRKDEGSADIRSTVRGWRENSGILVWKDRER